MSTKRKPINYASYPAISAIRYEATRIGWPVHFATDLAHDERAIASMLPREPFMASEAFLSRLMMTFQNWSGSASTFGRPGVRWSDTWASIRPAWHR